jgi:Fe2+ or Zn2+ uptake regulation protein
VSPHDPALCERCGAIRDVAATAKRGEACSLEGFQVARVERVYRGVCAECVYAEP